MFTTFSFWINSSNKYDFTGLWESERNEKDLNSSENVFFNELASDSNRDSIVTQSRSRIGPSG